jgi:hypothetical protein
MAEIKRLLRKTAAKWRATAFVGGTFFLHGGHVDRRTTKELRL